MLTGMDRIEQLVEEHPERKMQTLMHLVNKTTLAEVHRKQETGKARGIDGVSKTVYEKNLNENLDDLISRMRTFSYHPQPVRRTYIEKEGSEELRPLGIPAYEDRLVQGVIAEILTIIYEPKFYDFSYGFREGKSCHQAIKYLDGKLMGRTSWVVDADIKGFFNNVDHPKRFNRKRNTKQRIFNGIKSANTMFSSSTYIRRNSCEITSAIQCAKTP